MGSDPLNVVKSAEYIFKYGDKRSPRKVNKREYEYAYAIFDRDTHTNFDEALVYAQKIKLKNAAKNDVIFQAIPSLPCFEFWLLLHFEPLDKIICKDEAYSSLKKYIPNYNKNLENIFEQTKDKIEFAIQNSKRIEENFSSDKKEYPRSKIHIVVDTIHKLKK